MGLFDWFGKKKPADPAEKSPGGSTMIRHGEPMRAMPGLTEFSTLPYLEKREAVYQDIFGPNGTVHDDLFPGLIPHIDVYAYEPGFNGRDFYTLVTGGMSDLPMTMPENVPPEMPRRAEIVFYLHPDDQPTTEYISFLRTAAKFVYDFKTWLYWGHTIPNGNPPTPIFPGTDLVSLLFLFPLFEPDNKLVERLVLDSDPVHFLWIVPLTTAEHQYKLDHGTEALETAFTEAQLPFVFNRNRASCV